MQICICRVRVEYVKLKAICMPKQWKTIASSMLKDSGYPVYGANGIIGYYSEYNHDKETILVTCRGATCGSVNICEPFSYINGNAMALDNLDEKIDIKYLYYYLKKRGFDDVISGSAQPQITRTSIEKIEIPICEISKQKMIVNLFDKIELLINNQKRQLQLLDELVKARFVEMFGEYEASVKLSRYIKELRAGKSLAGKTKCKNKVLKTGAATFGFFDKEQYKYYPVEYVPNPLHKVEDGDVIISRMNTPELVGSCSYVFEAPDDMYYPDRLWKTIITEDTNPIFLWQLMWQQDIRKQIKENSFGTSGTMNNISKVKLLNIKAIDVPLELQNQFASFVQEIDKSRSRIQKSLEASQELFDSLMQEYFG